MPGSIDAAGAILTIDLAAVRRNYRSLLARLGGVACAAVVKADAYGLGATRVAPVLEAEGARAFFVVHLDEAAALLPLLRADSRVHVLNGLPPGAEAECAALGAVPVLNSIEQVTAWGGLARKLDRALPAVLQVDSGMSRLGLPPADALRLAAEPALLAGIEVGLVMSHLACADEPLHAANAMQRRNFLALRAKLPAAPASFANSAGIFLGRDYHFDLARPGAALYGLNTTSRQPAPMSPVVHLAAKVVQVREVPAGTGVGYGQIYHASGPTRIATIALGYADGWHRGGAAEGAAFYRGTRLPFAGRVSMDSITLDVTALPPGTLLAGETVDLIDGSHTADEVARAFGTIGYEVLTSLGRRFHRRYLDQ